VIGDGEPRMWPWSKREPEAPWTNDRELDFRVGQLVGACIMASHVLGMNGDEVAKAIGARLAERAAWFEAPPTEMSPAAKKMLPRSPTGADKP
jgi:hypothetical protein